MILDQLHSLMILYRPVLTLERIMSHRMRRRMMRVAAWVIALSALIAVGSILASRLPPHWIRGDAWDILDRAQGVGLAVFGIFVILFLLETWYYAHYFKSEDIAHGASPPRFAIAQIFDQMEGLDLAGEFLSSPYGRETMERCGVNSSDRDAFLASRVFDINTQALMRGARPVATVADVAAQVARFDHALLEFLREHELTVDIFTGAAQWVERIERARHRRERWWSRDRLASVQGIGAAWAYGEAFLLERFGSHITATRAYASFDADTPHGAREADILESILSRGHETNVLIVGKEGVGTLDVIVRLAGRIASGRSSDALRDKKIILFRNDAFIASISGKDGFEKMFLRLLDQAAGAGNIILVMHDFPSFLASARALGSDAASLMDPYLASSDMQIVAICTPEKFHRELSINSHLMSRFENIMMDEAEHDTVVRILEDHAIMIESRKRVFFTYPALVAVAHMAEQYLPYGVMPDKAIDLLVEIAARAGIRGKRIVVGKAHVLDVVTRKTGIPLGVIGANEKEKLENLEYLLHEHVVGQDEAVAGIAGALRRARSGLASDKRPVGTFLFLGPTGVGKTETAKALARVFFGGEDAMMRLDMSEYATSDALARLIGFFADGRPGILATMLREKPYGILLLDEFEKTDSRVRDLFLQILDEGVFKDMNGSPVSARNAIIIATSNAGSDLIWDMAGRGENPADHEKKLVDEIIRRGIFTPELVNRFDGVVVFHPLSREDLGAIARLMLAGLARKLDGKGIVLPITDALVETLVAKGYDPKFGARPMRRALEEHIEQSIADKMIRGELKPGDTVTFSPDKLR